MARSARPASSARHGVSGSAARLLRGSSQRSPRGALANPRALAQSSPMRRLFLVRHAKAELVRRARRLRAQADRARPRRRKAGRQGAGRPPHSSRPSHPFRRGARQGDGRDFRRRMARQSRACKKTPAFTTRASRRCSTVRARSATRTSTWVWSGTILGLANWRRRWPARAPSRNCGVSPQNIRPARSRSWTSPIERWEEVERNSAMLALYLTPAELEADAD